MNPFTLSPKSLRTLTVLLAIGVAATPTSKAVSIVISNQVNSVETSVNNVQSSAFFTNSPDNLLLLTNIAVTISPGLIGGNIGAGDASSCISTGTIRVVGASTSAGNWTDTNGIPAGITLSFNVQFTTSTTNGFLTLGGQSGQSLGNGIGITATPATTGSLDPGDVVEISSISITGVNFLGSLAESGFTFTPGTVSNPRWNRLRSNNLAEATEGTTVSEGSNVWGFGTSSGNMGAGLLIDNGYNPQNSTNFIITGPMVIETQQGTWNLKGLGFQYQVTYDITAVASLALDPPVQSGNSLTVSGSGPANSSYSLLETSDISIPRASWGTNTVGMFDAGGRCTNTVSTTSTAKFYILKTP